MTSKWTSSQPAPAGFAAPSAAPSVSPAAGATRFAFRRAPILLGVALIMLTSFTIAVSPGAATPSNPADPTSRSFVFSYVVKVKLPAGTRNVSAWVPLPTTDQFQTISELELQVPSGVTIQQDSASGGHFAYFTADRSLIKGPFLVRLTFHVARHERSVDLTSATDAQSALPGDVTASLQDDRWAPIDKSAETIAREQTQGITDPVQKARKIFEYVVSTTGHASQEYAEAGRACDSRGADCTGFNASFITLARAAGIPARIEIGFTFPEGEKEGNVPGYHCWAEFYANGIGWIPLDASRAAQEPEKRDDFFGSIDARRVMVSSDSDAQLPAQLSADRLNDLVDPHIEIDGKPCSTYSANFFFQEAGIDGPISSRKPIYAQNQKRDENQLAHASS